MNEFDLIKKYFLPLTQDRPEAGALADDAAIFKIPAGHELVVSSDTLNAGTHFLNNEDPAFIAHKALRTNLSDLAAMGAKPYAYQLCMAFPAAPDESWLQAFTAALLKDQEEFGIFCSGGDTTSIKGPLSISITVFGLVPEERALKRSGAKPGDHIILTGPVGDAWIGLEILQERLSAEDENYFIERYKKPTPRTALAELIRPYVHAAIDISDGLVADLGHIARASQLGVDLNLKDICFSPQAKKLLDQKQVTTENLLTGGDDYELLLAVPPAHTEILLKHLSAQGLHPAQIGIFTGAGSEIRIFSENGGLLDVQRPGWSHF